MGLKETTLQEEADVVVSDKELTTKEDAVIVHSYDFEKILAKVYTTTTACSLMIVFSFFIFCIQLLLNYILGTVIHTNINSSDIFAQDAD